MRRRRPDPAVAMIPVVTAVIFWFQNPVDRGTYEFGVVKSLEGVLDETPK